MDILYIISGALTGFMVGLTGVGGGALMMPILLVFFDTTPITAIATDLWFATITKLVGAKTHQSQKSIDWQIVYRLWIGSIPVALIIIILINAGTYFSKIDWLGKGIGLVVLITALGLLLSPTLLTLTHHNYIKNSSKLKKMQSILTVIAGGGIGLCISLTSVGAGTLGSMALAYLYPIRMTPHRLVATDIAHAIPLTFLIGIGYVFTGMVDWEILSYLLIGSLPAVWVGSRLSYRLPSNKLKNLLAIVLLCISIKIIAN